MEKEDEEKENQILQNLLWFGTGSVMAGTGIFGWDGRLGTMVEEDGGVEEFSTMINELWSSIFRSSHKRRDVGDAANDELYGVGVEDNLGLIFALIPKLVQDGSTKMKGNRGGSYHTLSKFSWPHAKLQSLEEEETRRKHSM